MHIIHNIGRKKVDGPFSFVITKYFGSTNLYKNNDEVWQIFIKDLVLYICKGYRAFSTIKNFWLRRLVLHQCPLVSFLFQIVLVDEVLSIMELLKNHGLVCTPKTCIYSHYLCKFWIWMSRGNANTFAFVKNFLNES